MNNNDFKQKEQAIFLEVENMTQRHICQDTLAAFLNEVSNNVAIKKDLKQVINGIAQFNYFSNIVIEYHKLGLYDIDDESRKKRDNILSRTTRKTLYLNTVSKEVLGKPFIKKVVNVSSYNSCQSLLDSLWHALWTRGEHLEKLASNQG